MASLEKIPLVPPVEPKIFRFADVDAFRSSIRNLNVDFTPLTRKISAEQIILNLPGCDVNYTKSFPRITDGQWDRDCTVVGLMMDEGVSIRFNGFEEDHYSAITLGSGGATYSQVERAPREFASIVFTSGIENRGWPHVEAGFKIILTSVAAQQALRRLILQITSVPSPFGDTSNVAGVPAAITESLLAAVDNALADRIWPPISSGVNAARQYKIFRDVQEVLSNDIAQPVYSGELAAQLGVSVRTLHDAVKRYRGMSLHRYLRLRRLWLVRKRLLEGSQSVKASALAFGFWHLGDFSKSYRWQFGETPSETLARSRHTKA